MNVSDVLTLKQIDSFLLSSFLYKHAILAKSADRQEHNTRPEFQTLGLISQFQETILCQIYMRLAQYIVTYLAFVT